MSPLKCRKAQLILQFREKNQETMSSKPCLSPHAYCWCGLPRWLRARPPPLAPVGSPRTGSLDQKEVPLKAGDLLPVESLARTPCQVTPLHLTLEL